jgi:hypothetical protein
VSPPSLRLALAFRLPVNVRTEQETWNYVYRSLGSVSFPFNESVSERMSECEPEEEDDLFVFNSLRRDPERLRSSRGASEAPVK